MPASHLVQVTLELWSAVICLFFIFIISLEKGNIRKSSKWLMLLLLVNIVLLVSDSLAYIYRGNSTLTGFYMTRISNFLVFAAEDVLILVGAFYYDTILKESGAKSQTMWRNAAVFCACASFCMVVANLFLGFFYTFDSGNFYVRSSGIVLNFVLTFVGLFLEQFMILRSWRKVGKWYVYSVITYYVLIFCAEAAQFFVYGFSFINMAITILTWLMFVSHEMEHIKKMQLQTRMLAEDKNQILLSSIQPHFLFNSLTAIQTLIEEEPPKAADAVEDLAVFLRASIDVLNTNGTISLERELETVESYIEMTRMRFGDKIQIRLIKEEEDLNFQLPPFTIQPLLENAVHHGIRKKRGGSGNIHIVIDEKRKGYEILVGDDGIGFRVDEQVAEEGHMGIRIVKDRLEMMCGGSLQIYSEPEKGTVCKIFIPKER